MKNDYQHGDVLIIGIDKIPESAELQKRKGDIIVAEGESTGHAHRIEDDFVKWYFKDNEIFIESEKSFVLRHEEHNPITIDPGKYRIGIVREFDHFEELERRVID